MRPPKLLILLALTVFPALFPRLAMALDKPRVRIGAIVPLSGDMALHGVEIQRSMLMALKEAVLPGSHYSYEILFEDNRLDGARSVSAAQKFLNFDKVDAVLTLWPPTANVVLPFTERGQVLHYTIAWDPELARKNRFLLSHQAMVDEIARSTLRLLRREGKLHVAFLHMEEAGFNLGAGYLRRLSAEEGISFVADEAFNPQENDFHSLVKKTAAKSPDAYLIWAVMPSLDALIRQVRELDPSAWITGYLDYAQDTSQIQSAVYVSEMFASGFFVDAYRKKYGEDPVSKGPNAYDITRLLVQAFEASPAKKLSALELKTYLTGIRDYQGAVGRFSIDKFGNSTYAPVLRQIAGAERKLLPSGDNR